MAKKIYVLDTSVYLTDFNAITRYENNDIVIPLKVLDEIDNHKSRQDGVGANARGFIRFMDSLREKGSLIKGVRLKKGMGLIRAADYDAKAIPDGWDVSVADNQIIATAIAQINQQTSARPKKVIVVSRDINMRVKCDSIGILAEDYVKVQAVSETSEIYTGFLSHLVDDQVIDQFYGDSEVFLNKENVYIRPNEFVMLISNLNEKRTAIARFLSYDRPLKSVPECNGGRKKVSAWGIKARNKEQGFALNLLRDPNISLVSLIGRAGSGKTLVAVASGLEQVLEGQGKYHHLIVSRAIQPMGKDIGFLPGTLEEKMMPWVAPIRDNLKFLMGNNNDTLDDYIERGIIEIEALTYIRGRSIPNAYIIIDEAQNLTLHELKTIITRAGEGTKIVLTGDIEQIDNPYLDGLSNGLTYAVEKFKDYELSGHVTLIKGERSKLATTAAKIL